jgi:hypothetical protein
VLKLKGFVNLVVPAVDVVVEVVFEVVLPGHTPFVLPQVLSIQEVSPAEQPLISVLLTQLLQVSAAAFGVSPKNKPAAENTTMVDKNKIVLFFILFMFLFQF